MNTVSTYQSLTKDDLTALRMADDVCFYRVPDAEPRDYIRAIRRAASLGTWSTPETERVIPVTASVTDYSRDSGSWVPDDEPYSCFYMYHGSESSKRWQTIVSALRAGDELKLLWVGSNNTETIKTAGLHADQLTLQITRGGRRRVVLEWMVNYQITPDNSARMIRRGRR